MLRAPASALQILALYALSGVLIGLSVNTLGFTPLAALAWVGCVPMFLAMKQDAQPWTHLLGVYLFSSIKLFFSLFTFITIFATAGFSLIVICSLLSSIPLWISLFIKQKLGWKKSLYVIPPLWTVYTAFISEGLFNVPILSFSLSQAPFPWLIQYIDITGHTGILFALLIVNVCFSFIVDTIYQKNQNDNKKDFYKLNYSITKNYLVIVVLLGSSLLYGVYVRTALPLSFQGTVNVALVQPGIAPSTSNGITATDLLLLQVSLTDSLVGTHSPDLIIWGEGGIVFPVLEDTSATQFVFQKVLGWETSLLTGTFERKFFTNEDSIPPLQKYLTRDYLIYNSALMITPQLAWMHLEENLPVDDIKLYNKSNLMPFTEYVPFSDYFPVLSNTSVYPREFNHFSKGNSAEYLNFATKNERVLRVSPIICWDLLSTHAILTAARTGSHFIAALTNESPLGNQFEVTVRQMENYTRLRSIESRRSIAKASLTGYSLFTNPFGEVINRTPWWSPQLVFSDIPTTQHTSFYTKHPFVFNTIILLIASLFIMINFFNAKTSIKTSHNKK